MNEQLLELYNNDANAPKLIQRGGMYTKKFLKWNRKQLVDGLTTHYVDKTKLFNPNTGRLINIKYDKRYKNKIVEKAGFKRKFGNVRNNSVIGRKPVYEITYNPTTWIDKLDQINHAGHFYNIFKNAGVLGQQVRVVVKVYDTTLEEQDDLLSDFITKNNGNFDFVLDLVMTPLTTKKLWDKQAQYMPFMVSSDYPDIVSYLIVSGVKCKVIITDLINLPQKEISQSFLDGNGHCLLEPINKWAQDKYEEQKTKGGKERYKTILYKINGKKNEEGLLQKYKDGVPQEAIEEICDKLQIKISIEVPFKDDIYIEKTSMKKPLKHFKYINSRLNHVEHKLTTCSYDDLVEEKFTPKELQQKVFELHEQDKHFIFGRNNYGISYIQTNESIYTTDNDYTETTSKFMKDNGINGFKIDALKNPDLQRFIDYGTHFNGTTDFVDDLPELDDPALRHIDIKKAYTQYHTCKYYDGMMGKITDFRKVDKIVAKGYYYIKNLNTKNANEKFRFYNKEMGWFVSKNVYTDAELKFLSDMGATYTIVCGAYGTTTDFVFDDDMIKKKELVKTIGGKELKISYYAKWVGKCASLSYYKRFCMYGNRDYFSFMKSDDNEVYYDEMRKEAFITYKKEKAYNLKHIAGQITAYQRLIIMEQLMEMEHKNIYRVCVDGIYYKQHDCAIMPQYQNKQDDMTFNNSPTECYLSSIFNQQDQNDFNYAEKQGWGMALGGVKFGCERAHHLTEFWGGQGGTGKTYHNIHDVGLVDPVYIAPSWKLARAVEQDIKKDKTANQNVKVMVKHRALYMEFSDKIQETYNTFLWDEASQYTQREKELIFKIDGKHIVMGDVGFQLEPVVNVIDVCKKMRKDGEYDEGKKLWENLKAQGYCEMTKKGFSNYENLTIDRRAKASKELRDLKLKLRHFIVEGKRALKHDKQAHRQDAIQYAKQKLKLISVEELQKQYKPTDLIIASKHDHNKEYNEMFKDQDKYLVRNNTKLFSNGEIVYTKPPKGVKADITHGYTIHAIQGESVALGNKLYIDVRNMFSDNMLYTAVSRGRHIDQIYIIDR